jgi:polygalacturonase
VQQSHGAVGDGNAIDTVAIQAAIDSCAKNINGGVVVFGENAQYLTAQVIVKDGVMLRVPKGTTILAGTKVRLKPVTVTCTIM